MRDPLVRLQNYSMTNESRTFVFGVVKELQELLQELDQKLERARIRKETAHVETERARRPFADAKTREIIAVDTFNALQKTKEEVEASLSAQMALLRPILRLHSDLLRQVFDHCQSESDYRMNMRTNIRLSSVCRAWRFTACTSRHLWSDIHLNPDDTAGLHIINTFLERANTHLNLHVDYRFTHGLRNTNGFSLEDLPLSRVQCLRIDESCLDSYSWPLEMPSVTQLVILRSKMVHSEILRSFPGLQSLELNTVKLEFRSLFILPKLTMIKWESAADNPHSLANLLKHAPNLETLSYHTSYPSNLPLAEVAFPPLDALVQLEFPFPGLDNSTRSMLRSDIHLSSIRHLLLWWTDLCNPVDGDFFIRYKDATSLKSLTIKLWVGLNDIEIEESLTSFSVLHHLQHIAHLLVDVTRRHNYRDQDGYEYTEFPQQFTVALCNLLSACDHDPVFPKLQTISFAGYVQPPITSLIQLASARRKASLSCPDTISCIQSFTFNCPEPLTVEERCCLDVAMGHCAYEGPK